MASKEQGVFLDVLPRLTDEVALDPSTFATYLFKEQLIPRNTWQNVLRGDDRNDKMANELMIALETKISGDGNAIYKLVNVLRKFPDKASLADEIERQLSELQV